MLHLEAEYIPPEGYRCVQVADGYADVRHCFDSEQRRELLATGASAPRRTVAAGAAELTAQENRIARLARDGLSNPEIGLRLFISPKTVQYHLSKVLMQLGITSRIQLKGVLL
jgi:DNA-binding NarL/FixJ family response regulator